MPKALQEVAHDALGLTRGQQLALAQFLLSLDEGAASKETDDAWDSEIRARLKAFDEGRVEALPFDQVREAMALRFAK